MRRLDVLGSRYVWGVGLFISTRRTDRSRKKKDGYAAKKVLQVCLIEYVRKICIPVNY